MELLDYIESVKKPAPRVIVRLTKSHYKTKNGVAATTSLNYLKRKCQGFNFFEEDISMVGADLAIRSIINLDKCEDGIYEINICNVQKDWETGYVDNYDYQLIKI